ncbi:MAG TPA: 16S rRNA (cytidine(1402)-2'-O)-methyltransferase [Vicinamibacterales bacterium]|nr:16S rRNA (cytidine(1402)-2'-O)-methyltransferase [Vicinamibacterales bacterium]
MAGILYVVATPIGNLEDVTLRALRVLRDVSLIAAEDTRRTARLLQHYSISTPTTSLHEHNERRRSAGLIAHLLGGGSMALVSDAGTPTISDPGEALIAAARAAGIRVESVPGPSAVMAALAASGLPSREFTFLGFPPSRPGERRKWLERILQEPRTLVFFEAPHRVVATLAELGHLIDNTPICIARELTKAHEELVVRPINELLASLKPLGEFTIIVPPRAVAFLSPPAAITDLELGELFGRMTDNNRLPTRAAVKSIAADLGLAPNDVYRRLQELGAIGRKTK